MDPYRTAAQGLVGSPKPSWLTRLWRAMFGRLVYGGVETCGHCKYWRPVYYKEKERTWSSFLGDSYNKTVKKLASKGDCKLIYSPDGEEKRPDETCDRFSARRRYKHRV